MSVTLDLERAAGDPVMGIDEAGRGPLVGGVYAGAVSVPLALAEKLLTNEWSAINDSKKLSEKKRFALAEVDDEHVRLHVGHVLGDFVPDGLARRQL